MARLSKSEQETIVRWSQDPEEGVSVTTHDKKLAKSLISSGAKIRRKAERGEVEYWILECPREWRRGPRKPRKKVMTEEQRKAAGDRLRQSRARIQS